MMYAKFKFKQLYKVQLLMFKQFINGKMVYNHQSYSGGKLQIII